MFRFLIFISAIVLLLDFIILGMYTYALTYIGIIIPIGLLVLFRHLSKKDNINLKDIKGWQLGNGWDLDDPDNPKPADVIFDENAIKYGSLMVGGPGSGKSIAASSKKAYFTKTGRGYAYADGKGDFDIFKEDVEIGAAPDYFFSSELESSDTINVMDAPTDTVIDFLSRVLVGKASEYYGPAQKSALRKVVPLLKAFDQPCNLPDLWTVLTVRESAMYLISKAEENGVDSDIVSSAKQYYAEDEEERLQRIDGLLNNLYPFVSGPLKNKINSYAPTLNIFESVKHNKRVYWHFPLSENAVSVATMVTEIYGVIAKNRQLDAKNIRYQYPLEFDDWGAFFYDNFKRISARCRSAEMPLSFYFQSKGQTDTVELGNIFTTEIMDNIAGLVVLRINGMDTAKWLSSQLGTYETTEISKNSNDNFSGETVSHVEKLKVRPDDIQNVSAGECHAKLSVTGKGGKMEVKLFKFRFPLPEKVNPPPEDWPIVENVIPNEEAEGLHLWRDFMTEESRKKIKKQAVKNKLAELEDEE